MRYPVLFALLALACEEDALAPTSRFSPTECVGDNCDNGSSLDSGGWMLDGGFPPNNTSSDGGGIPTGGSDASLVDSGAGGADTGAGGADTGGQGGTDTGGQGGTDTGGQGGTDAGPPPEFLNLSGSHRTHYVLDLSNYLLGLPSLAGPLDTIDQALAGNINTGIGILDTLIGNVIAQFIPPWVVTVIDVLNSVANFFEEVEARGTMNISQALPTGATSHLDGTEGWATLTVKIISGCPRGRQDPNYPMCAQQNIPIAMPPTPIGPLDIGVDVKPFTGTLQAGVPQADFQFDDREVDMELTKLVRVVIDLAINIGTNGQIPSLRDALDQAIDCAALEQEAINIASNFGLGTFAARAIGATVRTACDQEKMRALDAIINGINGIGIGWEAMQFDQLGHAVDTNGNGRPETLQVLTTPDTIDGRFRLLVSDPMGGVWEGFGLSP